MWPRTKAQSGHLTPGLSSRWPVSGHRKSSAWPNSSGRRRQGGVYPTGWQIHLLVVRVQLGLANPGEVRAPGSLNIRTSGPDCVAVNMGLRFPADGV